MSGHRWATRWTYNRRLRRWYRHCTVGHGHCTAIQIKPTAAKR